MHQNDNKPILIREIKQIDNHSFSITWSDEIKQDYRLADLQKNCPCANCVDELSGKRLDNPVKEDVRAVSIRNVGRYALQIQFASGCSTGIYSFDSLRSFKKKEQS